jgi:amino acid transporter
MILTGSRVYATLGEDFRPIQWLATWNRRTGAPVAAIAIQSVAALLWILAVGTPAGRDLVNRVLDGVGVPALPWEDFFGGFETLLAGSAPVFWMFFLLTGLAVFILRRREPHVERPFRIPFYPLPPLVFCTTCLYMIYSSLSYAGWLALLGVVPVAFGGGLLLVLAQLCKRQ